MVCSTKINQSCLNASYHQSDNGLVYDHPSTSLLGAKMDRQGFRTQSISCVSVPRFLQTTHSHSFLIPRSSFLVLSQKYPYLFPTIYNFAINSLPSPPTVTHSEYFLVNTLSCCFPPTLTLTLVGTNRKSSQ
ncbi:hypothetical protein YC2023_116099 [Brassica napus]